MGDLIALQQVKAKAQDAAGAPIYLLEAGGHYDAILYRLSRWLGGKKAANPAPAPGSDGAGSAAKPAEEERARTAKCPEKPVSVLPSSAAAPFKALAVLSTQHSTDAGRRPAAAAAFARRRRWWWRWWWRRRRRNMGRFITRATAPRDRILLG
jgi:hypothetical protein